MKQYLLQNALLATTRLAYLSQKPLRVSHRSVEVQKAQAIEAC